jgi:hypothetical protein
MTWRRGTAHSRRRRGWGITSLGPRPARPRHPPASRRWRPRRGPSARGRPHRTALRRAHGKGCCPPRLAARRAIATRHGWAPAGGSPASSGAVPCAPMVEGTRTPHQGVMGVTSRSMGSRTRPRAPVAIPASAGRPPWRTAPRRACRARAPGRRARPGRVGSTAPGRNGGRALGVGRISTWPCTPHVPATPPPRRRPRRPDAPVVRARGPTGSGRMGSGTPGLVGTRTPLSRTCGRPPPSPWCAWGMGSGRTPWPRRGPRRFNN